jgi:hypothetical protein
MSAEQALLVCYPLVLLVVVAGAVLPCELA